MRRVALLSDVHGNLPALEAVLQAVADEGIGERYCLGDLVGYGPDPEGVVDRLLAEGVPTVAGNYDVGVGARMGGCGCHYVSAQAKADGEASYRYTEASTGDAAAARLLALPRELRFEHEGARVLLVHGSPRRLNEYLTPDRSDSQLSRLAAEGGADVLCVGHVHVPYHRSPSPGVHVVSAGSVGKPKDADPRACWVELLLGTEREVCEAAPDYDASGPAGAGATWCATLTHRVRYDIEAVRQAMLAANLPPTLAAALGEGR